MPYDAKKGKGMSYKKENPLKRSGPDKENPLKHKGMDKENPLFHKGNKKMGGGKGKY